jgi:hypothetical protein
MENIARQKEKIAQARIRSPEADNYIQRLEGNLSLTQEGNNKLIKEMEEFLGKRD